MHTRTRHPIRRALTPWLAALSLWAGLVVPILDAEEWRDGAVVESAHDPGACVRGHDHTICVQVAASRALPSDAVRAPREASDRFTPTLAAAGDASPRARPVYAPLGSRAPPTA